MKKYIITFILFISMFFILNTAYAANGYTIDKYDVDIKINEDSVNKIIIGEYVNVKIIDYNEYDLFAKILE